MDSALLTKLFHRLFSHQTCSTLRSRPSLSFQLTNNSARKHQYHRIPNGVDNRDKPLEDSGRESHWQQRTDLFPEDKSRDYQRFPMVTADDLRHRRERPKKVKMLTRDFIEGMSALDVLGHAC